MAGGKRQPAAIDRQVTLGERTLTLRYGLKAMAAMQDHYGLASLDEVGARMQDTSSMSAEDLVAFVYAGTRSHHPELTAEEVMDLLDAAGLESLGRVIGEAFEAAADPGSGSGAGQSGAEGGGENPPTAAAGRSTGSSRKRRRSA